MQFPILTRSGRAALGMLVLDFVGMAGIGIVNAASAPMAPTITSGPSSRTASTSAAFAFKSAPSKVTFRCSLDSASYGSCTSPKTYSGLGGGSHRFRVEYQAARSPASAAATTTWVVDRMAPAIAIVFPVNGHSYGTAGYGAGCTPSGMCGNAADGAGVSAIQVSIRQVANTEYWNGTSFGSPTEVFNSATLGNPGGTATSWRYSLSLPTDGSYSLHIRALDRLSNTTPSGSYANAIFAIDTVPPPAPKLTGGAGNPPFGTSADFYVTDSEHGVAFQCSLDGGSFLACQGAPKKVDFDNVAPGDHVFRVRAVDRANNVGPSTSFTWTILFAGGFPISGSLTMPLYPGLTAPLNLSLHNPNGFALKVLTVSISVEHATNKNGMVNAGCDGPTNMVVSHAFDGPVTVPADSTKSLENLGLSESRWPQITMPDLPVNHDACKGTTFIFDYTGTATK